MKNRLLMVSFIVATSVSTAHATLAQQTEAKYVSSTYAQTQYPLVLTPGMGAFTRIGIDALGMDYWYQITPDLARNGANVWATRVSPFNSTEIRGEQLAQQVQEIIAITGKPKVNLIGHSHGGPTVRYVAGIMPNQIASVTAIASPNKGSPVADFILKAEGTVLEKPVVAAVNFLSKLIVFAQGLDPNIFPHDALSAGRSLTAAGSNQFNQSFPMGVPTSSCGEGAYTQNGIYFYSLTGTSIVTNLFDVSDYALLATSSLISGDNDGLVSRCSAKFGKTVRDNYNWNHFDEANMFLGLRGLFSQDPVQVYREHANRLKLQGL